MIEIRFTRQQLTGWEKESYARVLKEVITQIFLLNKGVRLSSRDVRVEIKIVFR